MEKEIIDQKKLGDESNQEFVNKTNELIDEICDLVKTISNLRSEVNLIFESDPKALYEFLEGRKEDYVLINNELVEILEFNDSRLWSN